MPEINTPIFPIPAQDVTASYNLHVGRDMMRGRNIAGPFLDAGGVNICLAQRPVYQGNLHRSVWHWFGVILQGQMQIQLGSEHFVASPGDLVCIPAGTLVQRTGLGPVSWIYMEIEETPMWASLRTIGPSIRKYESIDLMYILVKRITDAYQHQDMYSVQCAFENSAMLVTLLQRELRQAPDDLAAGHISQMIHLLDQVRAHPESRWDRASMASYVHMSERNLSRVFTQVFNTPPSNMVLTIRMDLATLLLAKTDRPLAAIATAVGYQSEFSFSRLFRKYVGVSPGQYRAKRRQQHH